MSSNDETLLVRTQDMSRPWTVDKWTRRAGADLHSGSTVVEALAGGDPGPVGGRRTEMTSHRPVLAGTS